MYMCKDYHAIKRVEMYTQWYSGGPQAPPPCHVAGVMPNCQSPYNRLWLAACTLFDLRLGFIGGLKLLSSFLSEASFIHSFILSRWFIHGALRRSASPAPEPAWQYLQLGSSCYSQRSCRRMAYSSIALLCAEISMDSKAARYCIPATYGGSIFHSL